MAGLLPPLKSATSQRALLPRPRRAVCPCRKRRRPRPPSCVSASCPSTSPPPAPTRRPTHWPSSCPSPVASTSSGSQNCVESPRKKPFQSCRPAIRPWFSWTRSRRHGKPPTSTCPAWSSASSRPPRPLAWPSTSRHCKRCSQKTGRLRTSPCRSAQAGCPLMSTPRSLST